MAASKRRIAVVFAILFTVAPAARAQESTAPPSTIDDWSFSFAPYVWASSLEGDVATLPGLPAAHVDASFGDIFRNLDFGFMGVAEVRKGRFGFLSDLIYVSLSADEATPGPLFGGGGADLKSFIGTFEGSYRAIDNGRGTLDLLAGVRVWSAYTKLSLSAGALPAVSRKNSETWADPIVGIRGRLNLGSGFYLSTLANIGGFGASSDLTWDAFGGVGYEINGWSSAFLGYRHLSVDYEKNGFLYDVDMTGPVIGSVFRF